MGVVVLSLNNQTKNNSYRKRRASAGDTIVEVLIATVVASVVIVGAFTIANKSSQQIRQSQERSEALKIASSAVETIRGRASVAMNLTVDTAYCTDLTTVAKRVVGGGNEDVPALASDQNTWYNDACKAVPNGGVEYYTSITRRASPEADVYSFEVHTRWDRLNGGERQDVTFIYRLNQ